MYKHLLTEVCIGYVSSRVFQKLMISNFLTHCGLVTPCSILSPANTVNIGLGDVLFSVRNQTDVWKIDWYYWIHYVAGHL